MRLFFIDIFELQILVFICILFTGVMDFLLLFCSVVVVSMCIFMLLHARVHRQSYHRI